MYASRLVLVCILISGTTDPSKTGTFGLWEDATWWTRTILEPTITLTTNNFDGRHEADTQAHVSLVNLVFLSGLHAPQEPAGTMKLRESKPWNEGISVPITSGNLWNSPILHFSGFIIMEGRHRQAPFCVSGSRWRQWH